MYFIHNVKTHIRIIRREVVKANVPEFPIDITVIAARPCHRIDGHAMSVHHFDRPLHERRRGAERIGLRQIGADETTLNTTNIIFFGPSHFAPA